MTEQIIEVGEKDSGKNEKHHDQMVDNRQVEIEKMYKPHTIHYAPIVFSIITVIVIFWGWQAELENYITPESGLGYALGITGGVMMLVMLLYSLRKRVKWMREWGPIRYWFSIHMMLGIMGPVLILFHCNFQLGSQNSNIALFSMLLVAASGIVGRYLYGRIHFGLYGKVMTLQQLKEDKLIARHELSRLFEISPQLDKKVKKYDHIVHGESEGLLKSFIRIWGLHIQTRHSYHVARRALIKACKQLAAEEGWQRKKIKQTVYNGTVYLNAHFLTVRKIAEISFFEKLFSLWHILHVPLFWMLIVTATIHIIAVHMY